MSQVNWKRPLALAFVLFALGLFAIWLEYTHKPEQQKRDEQAKKVFHLDKVSVQSISITDGDRTFALSCLDFAAKLCKPADTSKWELTQPVKLKADDGNAGSLVSAMNTLTASETIDLKDETPLKREALLKEYGIPGTRKVDVTTAEGETVLYLGQQHPLGDTFFAAVEHVPSGQKSSGKFDPNTVYLVPAFLKTNFEHDLTYWRDKKILTLAAHEVQGFSLSGTKAKLSADRNEGQWTLHVQPKEDLPGDVENIDNLITGATFMTAKSFVTDNKTDATAKNTLKGLKPVLTLSLQKEKGAEKELPPAVVLSLYQEVTAKDKNGKGKVFATVSNLDPLFEIEPSAKDRLDKGVKDLRLTKLISSMDRFNVKKMEFSGKPVGDKPLVFTQKDGKWTSDSDKQVLNTEKIQGLLDKLSGNHIKDFLADSSIPAGEPDGIRFTLADDKSPTRRQLVFWKSDNKLYARDLNSNRKEAFLLDLAVQDDLPWTRGVYFKK